MASTAATWSPATACGVQKVGLHWAENAIAPFPVGDSTLAAEAARLIYGAMAGSKPLETLSAYSFPTSTTSHPWISVSGNKNLPSFMVPPMTVVNDGRRRILLFVNDGYNPTDSARAALPLSFSPPCALLFCLCWPLRLHIACRRRTTPATSAIPWSSPSTSRRGLCPPP